MPINIRISVEYGTTNFHKILYTQLKILIGYKFVNLYLQISIIVEIRAINSAWHKGFCFKAWKYSVN